MEPLIKSHGNLIAMNEKILDMNTKLLQKIEMYREENQKLCAEMNNPENLESAVNRVIYTAFHISFEKTCTKESVCANDMERRIARRLATKLRIIRLRLWLLHARQCEKIKTCTEKID